MHFRTGMFIQLEGDCNRVYVSNKSSEGFDVIELQNGQSNTPLFSVGC